MASTGPHSNTDTYPAKPPRSQALRDYGIPALLFAITMVTTTAVGVRYMYNFNLGRYPLTSEADLMPYAWVWRNWHLIASGLPFSLTLIGILLAHEFGHFFACRFYGIRASLPFMLPAPSLSGTFGAVIRLRSRIQSRGALLAVAAWGPIAGFIVALAGIVIGLKLSAVPATAATAIVHNPQVPLIIQLIHGVLRYLDPSVAPMPLIPHPILSASWIGVLITALNLIPAGQLDGGHLVYTISPRLHRISSTLTILAMSILGIVGWVGWLLWSMVLLLPGMGHPKVKSTAPLSKAAMMLFPACALIFILCATPRPFAGYSLIDLLQKVHWLHR